MKIVVAIDFSPITGHILQEVIKIFGNPETKVWLVHVVSPDPDFVGYDAGPQTERDFIARKFQNKHKQLQETAEELKSSGLTVEPLLLQGPTIETIAEEADDVGADLIVTGSHGHGMMYNLFVGSVSKGLLKHAGRPVLIIPASSRQKH